jgi:RNA-directed DNA polymerase
MGSEASINLGLENIWQSWQSFRKGKRTTHEILKYEEHLEQNLFRLHQSLTTGTYRHGTYRIFTVTDNKKRTISVAPVQDRVVHRLLYNYLVPIFNHTFIYDAWSCRKGKGLIGAINRTQQLFKKYPNAIIWKSDIQKCFDHINHQTLTNLIARRVNCPKANNIIKTVIESYHSSIGKGKGISIGNLTSQIFSNMYLNELDRMIIHQHKPPAYLRYGDDFLVFTTSVHNAGQIQSKTKKWLSANLGLFLNQRQNVILKAKHGLKFLGVNLWPKGHKLSQRNRKRIRKKLNNQNTGSYYGLIMQHENQRERRKWGWEILDPKKLQ